MQSTGILTIGSKFILGFEKIFLRIKTNVAYLKTSMKEVIPQLRPSQQARSPKFSSEFLCLITSITINSLLVVLQGLEQEQ